jgi:hypothetical protein
LTLNEHEIELQNEVKLKESQNEMKKMEQQLRDLQNSERQLRNLIRDRAQQSKIWTQS